LKSRRRHRDIHKLVNILESPTTTAPELRDPLMGPVASFAETNRALLATEGRLY
jgi:hypothetical protein